MALPENFSYLAGFKVAGSAFPGDQGLLSATLTSLEQEGLHSIVSLTEAPLSKPNLAEFGISYLHEPVADFSAPSMEQIARILAFIQEAQARGDGVLVHCMGGIGRTGTLLACYLVSQGRTPEEAVREIRRLRPGSIEVPAQERAVFRWAEREKSRQRPDQKD